MHLRTTLITAKKYIKSRWYGSIVSCEESRRVGCLLNPTTIQAGVISHLIVDLNSPNKGILCLMISIVMKL